jgi:glycosyltransferase involved in cell wall biosynthesis
VDHQAQPCTLEHETVIVENGRLSRLLSFESASLFWRVFSILFSGRRRYYAVYTFECGWLSFAIAFIQTITFYHRPRHVILQFIMREKRPTWQSRLKYAFMRFCFSSVYLCVCSSRAECRYYEKVFGWRPSKLAYIPLHTDPRLLEHESSDGDFVLAAGRTFRDYPTLIDAFRTIDTPLVIVAGKASSDLAAPSNVSFRFDIPGPELIDLMARSLAVALPLEEREISIGQSVLLQAMTLGKPVIATRVNGTEDYIDHMETGILVPPRDPAAFRDAVRLLAGDAALRERLGRAARARVMREFLPQQYAQQVAEVMALTAEQHGGRPSAEAARA